MKNLFSNDPKLIDMLMGTATGMTIAFIMFLMCAVKGGML